MNTTLIETITEDDLILNGAFRDGDKQKPVVILIHGFTSDFYSHKFFKDIQESLYNINVGSIAIQTRGTGLQTEFIKKGRKDSVLIGSLYEKINEAHLDISAWIERLKVLGFNKFILAGHSLGTIKSVRYLFEGKYKNEIDKIILLAPFDKNGYIEKHTDGKWHKYVQESVEQIQNGNGQNQAPLYYDDYASVSYDTYVSWYEDTEINRLWDFYKGDNYDCKLLHQINIPVQIIVGDSDEFFYIPDYSTLESTISLLHNNIRGLDLTIIENCGHSFVGHEEQMVNNVIRFLTKQ